MIQSVENAAQSNYSSGTVEVSRRSGNGITFDAKGNMRWFWPLNPFGMKMGFYGIVTIGDVTFAGRGCLFT